MGKDGKIAWLQNCAGKCIYDKKMKDGGVRTAGKGNLYEDEKCKIKPV